MPDTLEGPPSPDGPEERARSRALRLLARRERTGRGLERSLFKAGFTRDIASRVVDDLVRRGLVDDRRFCALYLGEQVRLRPRSSRLLGRDLARAGVPADIVKRALLDLAVEWSEEALAAAAARKKARTAGGDPAKLSRLLRARGFGAAVTRQAVDRVLSGAESGTAGPNGASWTE